jgi:hypothetical protein
MERVHRIFGSACLVLRAGLVLKVDRVLTPAATLSNGGLTLGDWLPA